MHFQNRHKTDGSTRDTHTLLFSQMLYTCLILHMCQIVNNFNFNFKLS